MCFLQIPRYIRNSTFSPSSSPTKMKPNILEVEGMGCLVRSESAQISDSMMMAVTIMSMIRTSLMELY